jgi:hypothetical protein
MSEKRTMVFWRSGFVQRRGRTGRLYLVNGYRNSHWGGAMTKSQCIDEARRHGARAVFTKAAVLSARNARWDKEEGRENVKSKQVRKALRGDPHCADCEDLRAENARLTESLTEAQQKRQNVNDNMSNEIRELTAEFATARNGWEVQQANAERLAGELDAAKRELRDLRVSYEGALPARPQLQALLAPPAPCIGNTVMDSPLAPDVTYSATEVCPTCGGAMVDDNDNDCVMCNGNGEIDVPAHDDTARLTANAAALREATEQDLAAFRAGKQAQQEGETKARFGKKEKGTANER